MVVRIRWYKQRNGTLARQQSLAMAVAALLTPSALLAFTISFWSMAADFRWTTNFFVSNGLFAHWQSWLLTAAVLLLTARLLNRYASK